ncbi:hypothetical protein BDZ45DRAFT_338390 [Acephala macrosclerotiorum]|nr:hypothetical protein BDZ45DRAFT_338390 [Acephala macrosclerotiorum]
MQLALVVQYGNVRRHLLLSFKELVDSILPLPYERPGKTKTIKAGGNDDKAPTDLKPHKGKPSTPKTNSRQEEFTNDFPTPPCTLCGNTKAPYPTQIHIRHSYPNPSHPTSFKSSTPPNQDPNITALSKYKLRAFLLEDLPSLNVWSPSAVEDPDGFCNTIAQELSERQEMADGAMDGCWLRGEDERVGEYGGGI